MTTSPGSLTTNSGPPRLVRAEGSATEIGNQVGKQTAELIAHSVETYTKRFERDAGLSLEAIRAAGRHYESAITEWDTEVAAMLRGMARGSGQPLDLLVALNARTELLYGTAHEEGGCTSVSVLGDATADGHVLIGQNWDWRIEQQRASFVLATRDQHGVSVIALVEAGMLMKSGMNSSGIGLCNNLLVSDRDGSRRGAVPMHVLTRGVIQQPRMSLAHRKILPVSRASSVNLMLADAGGEAIDFELVPDDFGVMYPVDGLITHANHFETGLPVVDQKRSTFALTLLRSVRIRRLLTAKARAGQLRIKDLATAFRDDYSAPDALNRYPDPDLPEADQLATIFSVIMDLTERKFWIAGFPIDANSYHGWELDRVFEDSEPHIESFSKVSST